MDSLSETKDIDDEAQAEKTGGWCIRSGCRDNW